MIRALTIFAGCWLVLAGVTLTPETGWGQTHTGANGSIQQPNQSNFSATALLLATSAGKTGQLSVQDIARAAFFSNQAEAAKSLIKSGADVNVRDGDGNTPLHFASLRGEVELAKILIEAGADVNARDKDGDTPLKWASFDGEVELAEILIKSGADVNARDEYGYTPLHWATYEGHVELAEILIKSGTTLTITNNKGETAGDIAEAKGGEIAKLFEETSFIEAKLFKSLISVLLVLLIVLVAILIYRQVMAEVRRKKA